MKNQQNDNVPKRSTRSQNKKTTPVEIPDIDMLQKKSVKKTEKEVKNDRKITEESKKNTSSQIPETIMLQKKTVRKAEKELKNEKNVTEESLEKKIEMNEEKKPKRGKKNLVNLPETAIIKQEELVKPIKKEIKDSKASKKDKDDKKIEVKQEIVEEEPKNILRLRYHLKIPLDGFVKGTILSIFPDLKFTIVKEKKTYVCEINISDQNIINQILNEASKYKCKFNITINDNEVNLPEITGNNIEPLNNLIKEENLVQNLGNDLKEKKVESNTIHSIKKEREHTVETMNTLVEEKKLEEIKDNFMINQIKSEVNDENIIVHDNVEQTNLNNEERHNEENNNQTNFIKEEENEEYKLEDVREVTIENIPEEINMDKLKEIFFVFGDITSIEMIKQESKAYIKYKLCSSASRALRKMQKQTNNPRGLKVHLSNKLFRSGIEGDDLLYNTEEGRVVYLTFKPDFVPEIEELKKSLKRFGHIGKVFRRRGKNTIYVEFSNEASARDLVKDFRNKKYNWSSNNDLTEVNYVFLKRSKKEISNEREDIAYNAYQAALNDIDNNIQEKNIIEQNQMNQANPLVNLDYNHYWEVHYDDNYKRNFYFNPFLNESVWELPEGAKISPVQYSNCNYDNEQVKTEIVKANELAEEERDDSYYDDEAWDESDLMEKLVWDRMKSQQLKEWMKRPARQQVADTRRDTAYIEGNYDYNIWYDKYLTDRKEEREKIPAMHKCNPTLDTGYTKADLQEKEGGAYFCMYFAKGCCAEGVNCRYYHRVPTKQDAEKIENLRDVFGRSRFATHRNDMGGVGTFTKECRTLYVSDIKMIDTANPVKEMVRVIYENFSPWGEIEDINYIPTKGICFIRYGHRCFAEFAKEAMMDQSLIGEEVLGVKWAYDDPNPMSKKRMEKENENRFLSAYLKKRENLDKNNKGKKLGKDFNNQNYYNFYNNVNNPYSENSNTINYSSGYGNDGQGNEVEMYQREVQDMTNNCVKLSETLKMIDENFNNPNNNF